MKRRYYYIRQYDSVYRLSKGAMLRFFRAGTKGEDWDLSELGRKICDLSAAMPCDWEREEFAEYFKNFKAENLKG